MYDAKIIGAVKGLKAALLTPYAHYSIGVVILLHNLAAASLLADSRPAYIEESSQTLFSNSPSSGPQRRVPCPALQSGCAGSLATLASQEMKRQMSSLRKAPL